MSSRTVACLVKRLVAWLFIFTATVAAWSDETGPRGTGEKGPMSVDDIMGFREVREICLSPSGRTVAYVVRRANLATQRNDDQLVLLSVDSRTSRTIYTSQNISRLSWSPDEEFLYGTMRDEEGTEIFRANRQTATLTHLWRSAEPVGGFALSPDGSCCLVSTTQLAAAEKLDQLKENGAVFQWGRHTLETLVTKPGPDPLFERFVKIQTTDGQATDVGRLPFEAARPGEFVRGIGISPDNQHAVVQLQRAGDSTKGTPPINFDLGILNLGTGAWTEMKPGSLLTEQGAVWLGDSDRIFFVSGGHGQIYHVASQRITELDWIKTPLEWIQGGTYDPSTQTIFLQMRSSLIRLRLSLQQEAEIAGIYATPSFSANHSRYAYLAESLAMAPEIALFDTAGGTTQLLTHLNPELEQRTLARVERLSVTNSFGTQSTGFLVYPIDFTEGHRYPLILASYGFRGRFLTVAEWHSSFPVQTLAGLGYAILLLNQPPLVSAQQLIGNPVKARENEGWQVLSTFETAVRLLTERGIADREQLGLYGWSHGAFVVEFLLAHSQLHFRAACVGEGGDYGPGEYWLFGSPGWPRIFENTYGGPLTARTAPAYFEFSPVLSVDRVQTPLHLEFRRETAMLGLEFYVPLRMRGIPAELVSYEGEEHNFIRPTTRLASMHRKVDWFNYWMRAQEDPDPTKVEQYIRWRRMRDTWEKKKADEK